MAAGRFMKKPQDRSVAERKKAHGRIFRTALLASLALHLALFFGWRIVPLPQSPFAAAGPRAGDSRAAPGGGGLQAMNLAIPPPRPIVPPQVPLVSLEEVEPVDFDLEPQVDLASLLGGAPGLEPAPGIEGGTGRGDGGTAAEGRLRLVPPSPRGMIIPPTNSSLRGKQVEVWVFVNAAGRVVPDSTRLNPPTSDRGFNRRLIQEASEWVFNPATREGEAVPAWFPYTISM